MSQRQKDEIYTRCRDAIVDVERAEMREEWAYWRSQGVRAIRSHYTKSIIRENNERGGYFFFSKNTMRFFGDRMSNFRVVCTGEQIRLKRIRDGANTPEGMTNVGDFYTFNPETGDIRREEIDHG